MLSLVFLLFLHCDAQAAPPAAKTRSGLNTQIYEAEAPTENTKSFTSKVRIVRDIADEVEVFFDSEEARGAYTLPRSAKNYSSMFKKLEESKAPKGSAVSVTADSEKRIRSVEVPASPKTKSNPWELPDP